MTVELNHTLVYVRDKGASARFYGEILGLTEPVRFGPFLTLALSNGVTLDFLDAPSGSSPQHYAFLVDETDFDAIYGRITDRGITYYADPMHREPGAINHGDGGRGIYWSDPDGHNLEIITRPYGSGG